MRFVVSAKALTSAVLVLLAGSAFAEYDPSFESIFNGQDLTGWDGDPKFWSVQDSAITGQATKENPTPGNTFCIWKDGVLEDFELHISFKIDNHNSGIQYRSRNYGKWAVGGYQADFDFGNGWTGSLWEERGRGILNKRGEKVVIHPNGQREVVVGTPSEKDILANVKQGDWNEYVIIAQRHHIIQKLNGVVSVDLLDNHCDGRALSGILALQLHAGAPMKVQFKNIRLKKLPKDYKHIVLIGGPDSHAPGEHEHTRGVYLLAKCLEPIQQVFTSVFTIGWPKNPAALDTADAILIQSDGGGGHPILPHLEKVAPLMKKGVGLGCLHYAVEVPKDRGGKEFLEWIGGYFETNWSVNPHWTAKFETFSDHPMARGIKPFAIQDEWYYHMRFREGMQGVTPILSVLPPKETLSRPDGPHSGNPDVRKSVEAGEAQHLAWACERADGGRGFGFTGAHFHRNWSDDNFRKAVLNALLWMAKLEVPADGVASTITQDDLNAPTPTPSNKGQAQAQPAAAPPQIDPAKAAFKSDIIRKGIVKEVDIDITGKEQLYLVVTDGGNGNGCDWADWAEPRLVGPNGETKLTELKWQSATAAWGEVRIDKNCNGGPMKIDGKPVAYGIGTHAVSVIVFDLKDKGFTRFKARVGADNGGTDQGDGSSTSVEFLVFLEKPPMSAMLSPRQGPSGARAPEESLEALVVPEGLEVSLFASEPLVQNPTDMDIDAHGRVWITEGVNYRRWSGNRPEGDRIQILEDTDGDGKADKSTTFYQGTDVNAALGISVLGNKVIVSSAPNVFAFTDENGDDKPDRKEVLFTGIGGHQHDHSVHAFVFGPDGKLYFNFGNEGHQIKDAQGKPILDLAGNEINDRGRPYRHGMVFRCNLDGSEFETLAHNFRNNYEVCVDSFGTLWQSDNDDDGNRGVRINYVMEFGNFGYVDEFTGAGWGAFRTNWETEIPLRHWHQNDPGVVPNLLGTGGGSPTGICVYEGSLLPEVFRGQLLHTDAGPRVTRSYPVEKDGAGFKATRVDLLTSQENWHRPADVCVGPDGSVYVADWYDAAVGGHHMADQNPETIRGRVYRVAPKGHKLANPKLDFTSAAGAVEALKSPNLAVRYLAWTKLAQMQAAAEPELLKLWVAWDARFRSRAIHLLARIKGKESQYVGQALKDGDPDLRIVGLRIARALKLDLIPLVKLLVRDSSPQVRRECAIALRHHQAPEAADLWAELALQHDGKDRWYLEALGLAADRQEDRFFSAWQAKAGGDPWNSPAGRDIAWRVRSKHATALLAKILSDEKTAPQESLRFFRSFDFLPANDERRKALSEIFQAITARMANGGKAAELTPLAFESLNRLNNGDLQGKPELQGALNQLLQTLKGTEQFIQLIERFGVQEQDPAVLETALKNSGNNLGAQAARILLRNKADDLLRKTLEGEDVDAAGRLADALANSGWKEMVPFLIETLKRDKADPAVRKRATKALARLQPGAKALLDLAKNNGLPEELKFTASLALSSVPWGDIKEDAARSLPLPPSKEQKPLPPLSQLLGMKGSLPSGELVFERVCLNCHQVNDKGKEVGPNLSEIGGKLGKDALFEAILYPSAGISHNYEASLVELNTEVKTVGIVVSSADQEVQLKTPEGITNRYKKSEVISIRKYPLSLMPSDIQKDMSAQDLVDLVEYLTALKKDREEIK